jgi:hypothetical protein
MSNNTTVNAITSWVVDACKDFGLYVETGGDDFFEAGGTSLTAVKLIERAEEKFGEDALPPEDLFTRSTMGEIAASILNNRQGNGTLTSF